MDSTIIIGIISDYDEKKGSHPLANEAVKHAVYYLYLNFASVKKPNATLLL
jgi:hypothetical protein